MAELRNLTDREARPPTWAERESFVRLRDAGVEDVLLEPQSAPSAFWQAIVLATDQIISANPGNLFQRWATEIRWSMDWEEFTGTPRGAFRNLVQGQRSARGTNFPVSFGIRLSAVEHLLDLAPLPELEDAINEKARWLRVGLRIENNRFLPVQAEHVHQEVVQPTLLLLASPRLAEADSLYRKAFARALGNDPAGAITAASSAVEAMLRIGLEKPSGTLGTLTLEAKKIGWIGPVEAEIIPKLMALRSESDAHSEGTNDFERAMLAIHLAGSMLLYLGRSMVAPGK